MNALLQDEEHPQRLGVKNRLRRIGANLLLLGASLSLSIIVLEVAVRAILPQQLVLLRPGGSRYSWMETHGRHRYPREHGRTESSAPNGPGEISCGRFGPT
mgnify:CR=1 FL=1